MRFVCQGRSFSRIWTPRADENPLLDKGGGLASVLIAVGHEVKAEDLALLVRRYQAFGGESFHECAKGSEL